MHQINLYLNNTSSMIMNEYIYKSQIKDIIRYLIMQGHNNDKTIF